MRVRLRPAAVAAVAAGVAVADVAAGGIIASKLEARVACLGVERRCVAFVYPTVGCISSKLGTVSVVH
jgi:hypothetical protein